MNPLSIRLLNYRTFEKLDLDLPSGCVAIVGPNGSGKSSLANVVDLALFGPDGRSWSPYLTQGAEATEMMLELVFEHAGETYRVRRGYSGRGKGKATLDFEQRNPDDVQGGEISFETEQVSAHRSASWIPLTREKIDATQALVEETIGLTRETFRASSMLVQGDGAAFTEAQPRDRKAILGKILGLDRFDDLQALVRRDKRLAEATIQRITGALEVVEVELEGKTEVENALLVAETTATREKEKLTEATAALEEVAREVVAGEELQRRALEARAYVTEVEARLRPLADAFDAGELAERQTQVVRDELASLTTSEQIDELEREAASLSGEVEAYRQEVLRRQETERTVALRRAERDAIQARAEDLIQKAAMRRDEADHLEQRPAGAAVCDRCQQTLGEEARASAVASLRAEAEELNAGAADVVAQANAIEIPTLPDVPEEPAVKGRLAELQERLAKARQDELQRVRLTERLRTLQETVAAKPSAETLADARAAFSQAVDEEKKIDAPQPAIIDAGRAEALRLKAEIEQARKEADTAKAELVRLTARLERLQELVVSSAEQRNQRERLQRDLDRLAILERAYGRDGIPALIVQNAAIPSIETEACRILAELGTSYRVELRTEKALAGGGTADALEVVISTDEGERPYETFSGGERTRINLALRIALARLLAHRRGAESRLLVIDEPEFLDADGTAALARVLEGLAGDFERVYLISHVPDLRDAFDQTIEITRNGDGQSVVA